MTERYYQHTQSAVEEGVDRKTLAILKKRFLQVNNARLARMRSALVNNQHIFIDSLPLLFHSNHPMLPGYVSHKTPAGVAGYKPSKVDVQRGQKIARSFVYKHQPNMLQQIESIFLMGSCGSVAQSSISDLDIWVCYPSHLKPEQIELLQLKCDRITRWAEKLHIEAHFFLMSGERFRMGERESISTENCGSAQHYLLLDEFYRTGLLLVGRTPIWWLVPSKEEHQYEYYADTLRKKRFIKPTEALDFGGISEIPPGEFVGAGIWQLYKAIDSPYKSVLKLLLIEVYASEHPQLDSLSNEYKNQVYSNKLNVDTLDPYVMVYEKLERHLLAKGEKERLEFVRRCFYFKVGKALSRKGNNKSWQRPLMEQLTAQWGWNKDYLRVLDTRSQWKISSVIEEQKQIVKELTYSYRFLLDFARRNNTTAFINSQEMTLLGRKLYAAFERKAGKIEIVNHGIASDLAERYLAFRYYNDSKNTPIWSVYAEEINTNATPNTKPIKQYTNLLGLITWCHVNGVLAPSTSLNIHEGTLNVSLFELESMIRSLSQYLPRELSNTDTTHKHDIDFSEAHHVVNVQLYVNVGVDPLEKIRKQGQERLSDHNDSLGYSGLRENLVLNIEQLQINSWGEILTQRYDGQNALMNWLIDHLNILDPNKKIPGIDVQCFCPSRSAAIAQRVSELCQEIISCFHLGIRPLETRFIVAFERGYYCIQYRDQKASAEYLADYSALLRKLDQPQISYSPIVFDQYCLKNSILSAILEATEKHCIQVFYHRKDDWADIYIIDEFGSLYSFDTPFHDEYTLLNPLKQFISSTLYRRNTEIEVNIGSSVGENLSWLDTHFYEISANNHQTFINRRKFSDQPLDNNLNVQVIVYVHNDGISHYYFYCDHQEFSSLQYGDKLLDTVARYILSKRQGHKRYPCYVTDIDLSQWAKLHYESQAQVPMVTYFEYKEKFENQLNEALLHVEL